jgi:glycosyltransferase involved in cell wall biosynthesis
MTYQNNAQKIIIIGPAHPLRGGGMSTFNERLCKQLIDEGHQASIYTFSLQYPSFLFPGKSQYSNEEAPKNLPIKVCINSINPFNWIKIGWELKNKKPNIVIVRYWLPFMGPCLGTILRIIRWNSFTKIICIADNIIPHEKRIGDKFFTQYFLKPVHSFITMSNKVMQDLKKFTLKPAKEVIHPLYDNFGDIIEKSIARKNLKLNEADRIILFFGFIRNYKGLDILIDAMHYLQTTTNYDIKLLIAGEFYENEEKYLQQIQHLPNPSNIILHNDFIPNHKVQDYFCAADFIIQPYKNATQSGVTPLAYHFNKPLLVTNVGGLPQMVPHLKTGVVVEPTVQSITQGIEQLYNLGENFFTPQIIEEKKKYSWLQFTKTITTLAHEV